MEYRVDVFEGTRDVNGRIKCRCGFSGLMLMKDFIRKNFHMQNEHIREYLCAACKNRITEGVTFDEAMQSFKKNSDHIKFPNDGVYVDGSFQLSSDDVEEMEAMAEII